MSAQEQSSNAIEDLTNYLLSHEDDIAYDIEDYGELKDVFDACIGRLPEKSNETIKDL